MLEREELIELLSRYFQIGDSYAYNLTRVKTAFEVGTMSLEDFEEFDEETVADIADYLIEHSKERHTMTNYERIVGMSIDELADFLENWCRGFESCPACPFCDDCPEDYKISFADWLKKEVKHHD